MHLKHGKRHILTLFYMSHANILKIEPEISAKVMRETFFNFTYPIDIDVTLHTLKLKMAVEYEIVIIIAVNKIYQGYSGLPTCSQGWRVPHPLLTLDITPAIPC